MVAIMLVTLLLHVAKKAEGAIETSSTSTSGLPNPTISNTPAKESQSGVNSPSINTIENTFSDVNTALEGKPVYPSDSATFRLAASVAPSSLTPMPSTGGSALVVTELFHDRLVTFDSNSGKVFPQIATSFEWLDDECKLLHMHLRDDVYSQLGDHLTASDVLFSFEWGTDNTAMLMCEYILLNDFKMDKHIHDHNNGLLYELQWY